jgi:predicted exporter
MSSDAPLRIERRARCCFRACMVLLVLLAVTQWGAGSPLSSSLLELMPGPAGRADPLRAQASARLREPLARQLVVLVGAAQADRAVSLAQDLAQRWLRTDVFSHVQVDATADFDALRAQLSAQRLALLPAADRHLLMHDPRAFGARRARELVDPFASNGLVPAQEDLFGLARHAQAALAQPAGALRLDPASGVLMARGDEHAHGSMTWVLLVAQSRTDAFDAAAADRIAGLVAWSRAVVHDQGGELLVSGGPLYAAATRERAMREARWMSMGAGAGGVLILLLALRRVRALLAVMPLAAGLLCGYTACVAVFGSIHVITLAIGASLLGVALDFPLHLMAKSYGDARWRVRSALHALRPSLRLSLILTLLGYFALLAAPFPALRQTAVFSAAGLLGAYACTVLELPRWLRCWRPRPWPALASAATAASAYTGRAAVRRHLPWLLAAAAVACAGGLARLHAQDDVRAWAGIPDALVHDASRIGAMTGGQPSSQYFLVRGADDDEVLRSMQALQARLDERVRSGALDGYRSPGGVIASAAEQRELRARLADAGWRSALIEPLAAAGLPVDAQEAELARLAALPAVDPAEVLAGRARQRWRGLWLRPRADGAAGVVALQGVRDADAAQSAGNGLDGVQYVDEAGDMNALFAATRLHAAELKAASLVAAAGLLWWLLGWAAAWRIVTAPVIATAGALATLGYLGMPLTLFGVFGLLLASALALDYAIFVHQRPGGAAASVAGTWLAGATTLTSFGLLACSGTPALADFGRAVTLGVAFGLAAATWIAPRPTSTEAPTRKPRHDH